jgi:DNA polymerase-4
MPYFIHADLDAFYASVEQLDHSEYRGKPVIVGGLPDDKRSVVSTASYEARKFGVHSAMPIVQACRLCPKGIFLRGDMARYREKSSEVMAVFADFSPDVKQISVDEAFLDIAGTEGLFGPPAELARKLKAAVRDKTGLTVSVGLASNKYVAKIASGMSKPDGAFVVPVRRLASRPIRF